MLSGANMAEDFAVALDWQLALIRELLIAKNASYGNSFAEPLRVFAKGVSTRDQVNVRIDDKLSRIARGNDYGEEDTELDLIGYLILKRLLKAGT